MYDRVYIFIDHSGCALESRLAWGKCIRKQWAGQKVVLVIQVKDNSGLNQNDDDGAGEKWLEQGPILEVEPRKLANVLAANSEEKKGRVIHQILA